MQKKLYIQMFSVHGLLRNDHWEMGRDADTGGQIKYVVELAQRISENRNVGTVDLFTRLIVDKTVSADYSHAIDNITPNFRIIRIQCGGKKYIRKELLWPHLDEYVDKTIKLIRRENNIPDIVHGHYADGGYIAMQLAKFFGLPLIFTGHSLGRVKKQKLLNDGMLENDLNKKYKIDHRIAIEEEILRSAKLVAVSTSQEIEEQYGMYHNKSFPVYEVIPPGLDLDKFYPFYHDQLTTSTRDEIHIQAQMSVLEELNRFFLHTDKPLILALCRPDKRKNIAGLVKAYGEDLELQTMANLAIFAGIRKDITTKEDNERDVLTEMLLLLDKYDLYGKMAIPKKHDFELEVPALYRITAEKNGVFVNPALTEPFGLSLIEASAVGLPLVATNDGGPNDIIENCQNGLLIDATNTEEISTAIKAIISDSDKWRNFSTNGIVNVRKHYTWDVHVKKYAKALKKLVKLDLEERNVNFLNQPSIAHIGKRLINLQYFLITDIDNTLIGGTNEHLEQLIQIVNDNHHLMGFAVATGRSQESAIEFLKEHHVPHPDIIISSVGSEIYYGKNLTYDQGWATHISNQWKRDKIEGLLQNFNLLQYQAQEGQRKYKISYDITPEKDCISQIHDCLMKNKCSYNLIFSHEKYLDILPNRASKGKAIRYLSYKWEIPLENFLVCGDSGNDEEMLRGVPPGVIVANYSPELEQLKGTKNIYFANAQYAGGIIEGLDHYKFIELTKKVAGT